MPKVKLEEWEREHVEKITKLEHDRIGLTNGNRKATIACGKELRKLQEKQKKQQEVAKARGEDPVTWKEYADDKQKTASGSFPNSVQCGKYMLVYTYRAAWEPDMSLDKAYKAARAWKENGGNPPLPVKVSVDGRLIAVMPRRLGKSRDILEKFNGKEDLDALAVSEGWSEGNLAAAERVLEETRKEISLALNRLRKMRKEVSA